MNDYPAGMLAADRQAPVVDYDGPPSGMPDDAMDSNWGGTHGGNGHRDSGEPRSVAGSRRVLIGWDAPVRNGDRSELTRDLADGQGLLRETRVLVVDDS